MMNTPTTQRDNKMTIDLDLSPVSSKPKATERDLEVDVTGPYFGTTPSPHTCHSTEFSKKWLGSLFQSTHRVGAKDEDAKRALDCSEDLESLGASSKCEHCANRYLLLAEALAYHHAMLTSGSNHRRAAHYARQRSEVLAKLGYTTV